MFAVKAVGTATQSALNAARKPALQPPRRAEEPVAADLSAQPGQSPALRWDFRDIPLFPPGRGSASQTLHPLAGVLQRKLEIGAVDDPLEREADRVADQVMRLPLPPVSTAAAPPTISRKCAACEEEQQVQRRAAGPAETAGGGAPAIVHEVLRSPGQPLDAATRAFFEPRFRRDFSRVRVHTGPAAERSAHQVGALAYTVGNDIVFGAGAYSPLSSHGAPILAHELVHTLQQSSLTAVRRAPGPAGVAEAKPLGQVAIDIARLVLGGDGGGQTAKIFQKYGLKRGPVLSVIRDEELGRIYVGFNTGIPKDLTQEMTRLIELQQKRIGAGEVVVVHTSEIAVGGHAEVNALNAAEQAAEKQLGRALTEAERGRFEMQNVWLEGDRVFTTAGRCEHCRVITRGVSVTVDQFRAEGGVSGVIDTGKTGGAGKTGAAAAAEESAVEARGASARAGETALDTERAGAARAVAATAELGRIGALDAATFYLQLHEADFAALEEVSKRVEKARDLLDHVKEFEAGALALRARVDGQLQAEAKLPADPLATGDDVPPLVTYEEMQYVRAYEAAGVRVSDDAFHARLELNKIIQGWDHITAVAEKTSDFTRQAVVEATQELDLRFARKGGSFRAFLVSARDDAARAEQWATWKWQAARDILRSANMQELLAEKQARERALEPGGNQPGGYGEDVLKFSKNGQKVTSDSLLSWARQNYPGLADNPAILRKCLKNIYASHEFSGSQQARDGGAVDLVLRLRAERRQKPAQPR